MHSKLVRPLMQLKSHDLLYTSSEALYRCYKDKGFFCFYVLAWVPTQSMYNPSDVLGTLQPELGLLVCGWNEA